MGVLALYRKTIPRLLRTLHCTMVLWVYITSHLIWSNILIDYRNPGFHLFDSFRPAASYRLMTVWLYSPKAMIKTIENSSVQIKTAALWPLIYLMELFLRHGSCVKWKYGLVLKFSSFIYVLFSIFVSFTKDFIMKKRKPKLKWVKTLPPRGLWLGPELR